MSLQTTLITHQTLKIAHLTISRPKKLNALNTPLLRQIPEALRNLSKTPNLLAVTLTGAGDKAFIGGADLAEMAALSSPAAARTFISHVHAACDALRRCPVPVIARVNGFALGAGLEIAAACDVRVASRRAVFGMPEVCLGIPSVVEAALLPGLIGWGRTRQLLLFGGTVSAEEALRWGLVERVVGEGELDGAVRELTGQLAGNGLLAVRRQKALISRWEELSLGAGIEAGVEAFGGVF
ncbi:hypothetical protein N7457_003566 [Penicillium paradoxum]|uniref:uncharacterized protein n=1 Tax=Penicillium paradoxum TaxID=176176 RepID=UPI002548A443|nr:uncharacterized protein N7457_003566 [Penicillium paradoxum]KAJ5788576.1 hypothetical protein N7457_003566 [Penicillium paradoxum]